MNGEAGWLAGGRRRATVELLADLPVRGCSGAGISRKRGGRLKGRK
jgi:hypothetical protein